MKRFQKPIVAVLFVAVLLTGTLAPVNIHGVQEAEALFWIPIIAVIAIAELVGQAAGQSVVGPVASFATSKVAEVAGSEVLADVVAYLSSLIESLTGWFLQLTGTLLDVSIGFTTSSSNLTLGSVLDGWEVVRDVANLFFIFILLYIGFMTILQLSGFQTKRVLVRLIMAALFINFSAFFAGFVIDVANVIGTYFYSMILGLISAGSTSGHTISSYLSQELRLGTLLSNKENVDAGTILMGTLIAAVVQIIAAFVFLSMAIMFFIRSIALMFLIILSPLAFLAAILPKTAQYFTQWLSRLVNESFVYPVFMLMLLIIVKILASGDIAGLLTANAPDDGGGVVVVDAPQDFGAAVNFSNPDVVAQNSSFEIFAIFVPFVLILGFIIAAMKVSKQMAASSGAMASKLAGAAVGIGAAGVGMAGRRIIGGAAHELATSKTMSSLAQRSRIASFGQRQAMNISKSSFDARSGVAGSALKTLSGYGGVGSVGSAGGRGGYKKSFDDAVKTKVETAESLDGTGGVGDEWAANRRAKKEAGKFDKEYRDEHEEKLRDEKTRLEEEHSYAQDAGDKGKAKKLKEEIKKYDKTLKSKRNLKKHAKAAYEEKLAPVREAKRKEINAERKERIARNMEKGFFGIPGTRRRVDRAAAAKFRKGKPPKRQFQEFAKSFGYEFNDEASSESKPSTPPPENTSSADSSSGGASSGGSSSTNQQA